MVDKKDLSFVCSGKSLSGDEKAMHFGGAVIIATLE